MVTCMNCYGGVVVVNGEWKRVAVVPLTKDRVEEALKPKNE